MHRQLPRGKCPCFNRLKWDVDVVNGLERDKFDAMSPLYLILLNRAGAVQWSLRLLPTTGPNMLRDVFPSLLPGEVVESGTIGESSRFAIHPDASVRDANTLIDPVTSELLCGLVEVGLMAGLSFIVTVFDARMKRILRMADCPIDPIGTATAYAGLIEVSEQAWRAIAAAGGRRHRGSRGQP